ncbi:MAG: alpha/beta fold hydrolase [Acidobacteriota bacterium]
MHASVSTKGATASRDAPRQAGRRRRLAGVTVAIYLTLLVVSHLVRWATPPADWPQRQTVEVPEVKALSTEATTLDRETATDRATVIQATGDTVEMAWREWLPEVEEPRAVILLLHGSPGTADNFDRLAPALAARGLRVVAPDLPGFGGSSHDIADYSIRAHAFYTEKLLDHLGIQQAHGIGFSMGGGVILHMTHADPGRLQSLVMLSAIGVQEHELLGQYHLNHAVHAAQLVGLWLLHEMTPHFGLLDRFPLDPSYARNFFDTDQRPLRELLERYAGPMLVIHGEHDVLVPYRAAQEHYRLVPQSEMVSFDANHFMPFTRPGDLVEPIVDFVDRVEAGEATLRSDASPDRRTMASRTDALADGPARGAKLLFWMALIALATLVSEDLTCIAVGLLVARGALDFVPGTAACALGIVGGDMVLYTIGRLGRGSLSAPPVRWIVDRHRLERSRRFFERRGPIVILISRFVPGLRLPTYLSAGALGMPAGRFFFWLLLPTALWTPLLVGLSTWAGESVFVVFDRFQHRALPAFLFALGGIWLVLGLGRALASWRGRRLMLGRWHRWTRWEFWSPWIVYPLLAPVFIWLALRHRSPTLFTAVNPSLPNGGGLIGESKSQILELLDPGSVASWRRLEAGTPTTRRTDFSAAHQALGGGWPVVLKPDVGQRGSGVTIARTEDDVERFLERHRDAAIVQRFVAGEELGVFYTRRPGNERGEIFAITEKILPHVAGDGESTVERLVLADTRAVAMAPHYLNRLRDRLDEVPAAGEPVALAELGTHSRGAVFRDGGRLLTPELSAAVDRIARSAAGFDFGRFDLKAPSHDHFRRGEGLKVLELNGVSSEATNVYDHGLAQALGILARQWRLAWEIGGERRARGHGLLGVVATLRLVLSGGRWAPGATPPQAAASSGASSSFDGTSSPADRRR